VKFELMLFLPGPFLFVLIPVCGDVALFFDVLKRREGVTAANDEIVTNPASANELYFLQIHGALCMTEDGFCLTVNGSSRVKRCIQAGAGGFTNLFADIGTAVLPVSDLKIVSDTFYGDLISSEMT
jgi:hypothetical protein